MKTSDKSMLPVANRQDVVLPSRSVNEADSWRLAFTAREVCNALGISRKTLSRLESRGLIASLKVLRTKLYTRAALLNFLEEAK